jgi:RNA polymerase sigma-70 factor (ECF subfamily)
MDKVAFVRACREGGAAVERALRELDRALFARLLRECLRAVQDRDLAQDLVQETLIKVWRNCASFRAESELLPWVRVILRRTILDQLRRHSRETTLDEQSFESATAAASANGGVYSAPERAVHDDERQAAFERGWRRLQADAPAQAAVLAWIVDDGLGNAEIAELLGRSPGATREFISQCRKRARLYLAEWHALAADGESP